MDARLAQRAPMGGLIAMGIARRHPLDASTTEAFAREGAVVLRGALNPADLLQLEQVIEHSLAHLSPPEPT